MHNLYEQFRQLIPDPPLQAGTVVGVGSGVVTVALPGGSLIRARGIVIGSIVLEKERAFLKILKGIACWATVFEQALG